MIEKCQGLRSVCPSLRNKKICFLGSSVTYGAASGGISFVEYIAQRNDCQVLKETLNGTTLVDQSEDSYIARLKKIDKTNSFDLFVCQLSTNDASQHKDLGSVGSRDVTTIAGAIHFIIRYVKKHFGIKPIFFTSPYYESDEYARMVQLLKEIQKVEDIVIINMFEDEYFNIHLNEKKEQYMADSVHPTSAGYLECLTPYIEKQLINTIK